MALIAIALLQAGCGSPSSGETTGGASFNAGKGQEVSEKDLTSEFARSGRSGRYAKFGVAAEADEREAASAALAASQNARAKGDYQGQCATLTREEIRVVTEGKSGKSCEEALTAIAAGVPARVRAATLQGPIDVLRVGLDGTAYALYHGSRDTDFVMPMTLEGGSWKVNALLEGELPPLPKPEPKTGLESSGLGQDRLQPDE